MFSIPKGYVCTVHMLPLLLANWYIQGYITRAYCNIKIILWNKKNVVGTCERKDKRCWGVGASTSWYICNLEIQSSFFKITIIWNFQVDVYLPMT